MRVVCHCEHCQKKLRVTEDMLGKMARCPNCGGATALHPSDPAGIAPAVPLASPVTKPIRAEEALMDLEELPDEAPRPRGKRKPLDPSVRPHGQWVLRWLVLLNGLIGAAFAASLAFLWQWRIVLMREADVRKVVLAVDGSTTHTVDFQEIAAPLLYVGAAVGLVGALLGFVRVGILGGLLLLLSVAAPGYLSPESLNFTSFLIVAGLLSLFIGSPRSARKAAARRAEAGQEPKTSGVVGILLGILGTLAAGASALVLGIFLLAFLGVLAFESTNKKSDQNPPDNRPKDGPAKDAPKEKEKEKEGPAKDGFEKDGLTKGDPKDGPAKGGLTKDPPKKDPPKVAGWDAIKDDVEKAGKAAKLVKLDLSSAGLDATILAPEGCKAEGFYGGVFIKKDEHFSLKVMTSEHEFNSARRDLKWRKPIVEADDLILASNTTDGKERCTFATHAVIGHRDVTVENAAQIGEKFAEFSRAECLLMVHCARTIAPAAPVPDDPAAALAPFKSDESKDADGLLVLNNKATTATLALVPKLAGVRHLDLSSTYADDPGMTHLQEMTGLQTLRLRNRGIGPDGVARLADLTGLKELNLHGARFDDEAMKHLAGMTHLEVLELGGMGAMKGPGLDHLASMTKLKDLSLDNLSHLEDTALSRLKAVPSLNSLNLSASKLPPGGLTDLAALPKLKRLRLQDVKTDAELKGLGQLVGLEELSVLDTEAEGGLAGLRMLTKLKTLSLRCPKVTDATVAHLAGLTGLETLDLTGAAVTDAGLKHLPGLKKLKVLLLGDTKVTLAGVKLLEGLDDLSELSLYGTKAADYVRPKKVRLPDPSKPSNPQALVDRVGGTILRDEKADGKPVVAVYLNGKPTDADLADVRDVKTLRVLRLGYQNAVTEAGLTLLKGLTNLEELHLGNAKVAGDGFAPWRN